MSLENAFNFLLEKASGENISHIKRRGEFADMEIKIAPSNYFASSKTIEEIELDDEEFVVSNKYFKDSDMGRPERGDIITSSVFGEKSVIRVKPLYIMGNLIAFRIRLET